MTSLQERFLQSRGEPVEIDGEIIFQQDQVPLPEAAIVKVEFVGSTVYSNNAAVLSISHPGAIHLTDSRPINTVRIWDEEGLSRTVCHTIASNGQRLRIHNMYRTRHNTGEVTEDKFTGNAGMVIREISPTSRRYYCSSGPGPFSMHDLVFEVSWKATPH